MTVGSKVRCISDEHNDEQDDPVDWRNLGVGNVVKMTNHMALVKWDSGRTLLHSVHSLLVVIDPGLETNQIVIQPQCGVGITDGIV